MIYMELILDNKEKIPSGSVFSRPNGNLYVYKIKALLSKNIA